MCKREKHHRTLYQSYHLITSNIVICNRYSVTKCRSNWLRGVFVVRAAKPNSWHGPSHLGVVNMIFSTEEHLSQRQQWQNVYTSIECEFIGITFHWIYKILRNSKTFRHFHNNVFYWFGLKSRCRILFNHFISFVNFRQDNHIGYF